MTKPAKRVLVAAPFAPSAPSAPRDVAHDDDSLASGPPEYDPAEYRWVPVRRRARYDGWTEEKQRRFIEVLADTGLVSHAAREVGMTRASAYRLRRAAHAGAFARAWDRAREVSGALIEDIAFERAIDGVELDVYARDGEVVGTRTVYNDRLLVFLLRHLKPEIYTAAARERRGSALLGVAGPDGLDAADHAASLDAALRAMEPALPAAPEALLGPDQLASDLLTADAADGKLPHFFAEQRPVKSAEQAAAEDLAAQRARGQLATAKMERGEAISDEEFADMCHFIDPAQAVPAQAGPSQVGPSQVVRPRRKPGPKRRRPDG